MQEICNKKAIQVPSISYEVRGQSENVQIYRNYGREKLDKTAKARQRMELCPRFKNCSCPLCPLDKHISWRVKLPGEPSCPYTTRVKKMRIRPIPKRVKQFLIPAEDGGYVSAFQKGREGNP